eukprot:gnl/Dysnectes_brevis/3950_a5148_1191.p1 GENE.gnl/Dysnectes_brevis/3950_a5148_1191~~gnl/Dysnectes_brevis/3950_a5148_1191.p1  ORF type:complete len:414 (+),score=62.44 gnl/Dysnectes_brevis/3950_a5148_1191:49-1242(+)
MSIPSWLLILLDWTPVISIVLALTIGWFEPSQSDNKEDKDESESLLSNIESPNTVFTASDVEIKDASGKPDFGIDGPWLYKSLGSITIGCFAGVIILFFLKNTLYSSDLESLVTNWAITGFCLVWVLILRLGNTKLFKFISRNKIIKDIQQTRGGATADTRYLDMACGRGLMLCGVGRWIKDSLSKAGITPSVTQVTGVDIFSGAIQSGNGPAATLTNAVRAGIQDITEVRKGSATELEEAGIEPDSLDVMTINQCLSYIKTSDRQPLQRYWLRFLKAGGSLYVYDTVIAIEWFLRGAGGPGAIDDLCIERYTVPFFWCFPPYHFVKITRPSSQPDAPVPGPLYPLPVEKRSKLNAAWKSILGTVLGLVWAVLVIVLLGDVLAAVTHLYGIGYLFGF